MQSIHGFDDDNQIPYVEGENDYLDDQNNPNSEEEAIQKSAPKLSKNKSVALLTDSPQNNDEKKLAVSKLVVKSSSKLAVKKSRRIEMEESPVPIKNKPVKQLELSQNSDSENDENDDMLSQEYDYQDNDAGGFSQDIDKYDNDMIDDSNVITKSKKNIVLSDVSCSDDTSQVALQDVIVNESDSDDAAPNRGASNVALELNANDVDDVQDNIHAFPDHSRNDSIEQVAGASESSDEEQTEVLNEMIRDDEFVDTGITSHPYGSGNESLESEYSKVPEQNEIKQKKVFASFFII